MALPNSLENYQSDVLLLLIGTNPLPNLVAVRLLARPKATLWLLHSGHEADQEGTLEAAQALETKLMEERQGWDIRLKPISSADPHNIEQAILKIAGPVVGRRVGLHYTGGTKPMAVHAYRVLERALAKAPVRPIFTYLDPRTLALRIDGYGNQDNLAVPLLRDASLRQHLGLTVDELAALHGYERLTRARWASLHGPHRPFPGDEWATLDTPDLDRLCQEIALVHADTVSFKEWKDWRNRCTDLPTSSALQGVRAAMEALCRGTASDYSVAGSASTLKGAETLTAPSASGEATAGPGTIIAQSVAAVLRPKDNYPKLTSCQKWFQGIWLEEYCLASLQPLAMSPNALLHHYDSQLMYSLPKQSGADFELDVAATLGYQLFALSCQATENKDEAKEHLMEVYVRARQLGGDEARVALVCAYDDPNQLCREIERSWDAGGKIRVFGRADLRDLPTALSNWIGTSYR